MLLLHAQASKGLLWPLNGRYYTIRANRICDIVQPQKISLKVRQFPRHYSHSPGCLTLKKSEMSLPSGYTVRKIGAPNTLEHRIYIEKDGIVVSPFHDIPLYANDQQTVLNMVVEIPRWTNAKMEVMIPSPIPILLISAKYVDFQRGTIESHQTGHQEGQASLRSQLLPPQRLPLELRLLSPGMIREPTGFGLPSSVN